MAGAILLTQVLGGAHFRRPAVHCAVPLNTSFEVELVEEPGRSILIEGGLYSVTALRVCRRAAVGR
jgi:hypothetical protein